MGPARPALPCTIRRRPDTDRGGAQLTEANGNLLTPLSMIMIALVPLLLVALLARRWPTREDLALRRGLSGRDLAIIAVVFVVSHLIFFLLGQGGEDTRTQAERYAARWG